MALEPGPTGSNAEVGRPVAAASSQLRICTLCEATCRVVVDIDDGVVTDVRGDKDAPFSRGHLCAKGRRLGDIDSDPDRVQTPLKRVGDQWRELSWDEAFDEVAERIVALQREHGDDAVAIYLGNPSVFDYATVFYSRFLLFGLRTAARFSASSLDGLPHQATSFLMFGNQFLLPVPDIDRTDLFVIIGANPAVSNGSVMTAPGISRRLRDLRERGGRLVVVDPRRTETAMLADQHLAIRPGTDPVLLLGLIRVVLSDQQGREKAAAAVGLESVRRLRALCDEFDPDRTAMVTGIPVAAINELATGFAAADRAVCYGRIGAAHQRFSSLTCWLITTLNAITGNLDRPGGAMFTRPAVDLPALSRLTRQQGGFGRPTRVNRLPSFGGELPVAALADEIETPGRGQIRGLLTLGGNLVLSAPNGKRLDGLFGHELDLMVAIDPYLNETTRHADYLLPPARSLQRDQYALIPAVVSIRNIAEYAAPAVPAAPGTVEEWEILNRLHRRIAHYRGGRSAALQRPLGWATGRLRPERLLDVALRVGPYGLRRGRLGLTRSRLAQHRHGLDLGPLVPMLARRRVRPCFVPDRLAAEVERLRVALAGRAFPTAPGELVLVGRRQRHGSNSWLHNIEALADERCVLLMHPDDAATRGIADCQPVRIRSHRGQIETPVRLTTEMMPGVVSLPHGWGHGRAGLRLRLASARGGASMNDLTDERCYDAITGTAQLSGIPVSVDPAMPAGLCR